MGACVNLPAPNAVRELFRTFRYSFTVGLLGRPNMANLAGSCVDSRVCTLYLCLAYTWPTLFVVELTYVDCALRALGSRP